MKHIGLVLSGGMGKGAYQIGALLALSKFFDPSDFEIVSSASVGALNSYAFLTDQLDKAKEIWMSVDPKGDKRFITSVLKSSYLQDVIEGLHSNIPLNNAFYIPLFDINSRKMEYYDLSEIPPEESLPWLRASVSLPIYNKGVHIDSKVFYDGAMIDNIPIYPLLKEKLDYIICIYFDDYNYIFEDHDQNGKIIKLIFSDKTLISNSVYITHESISHMIEEGYEKTLDVLTDILGDNTSDLEKIYQKIQDRNNMHVRQKIRITGDIVVTNINKVMKRMFFDRV